MTDLQLPCKYQKGDKMGKETAKVLMSVIKSVAASASPEHRNKQKTELERKFNMSDEELYSLIAKNHEMLSSVMTTFAKACRDIGMAKAKLSEVKRKLQQSKLSLSCRSAELRQLWVEGMEHKHALQILDKLEKLKSNRDQYFELMNKVQGSEDDESVIEVLTSWMEESEEAGDELGDNDDNGIVDIEIVKEGEQQNSKSWLIDFMDTSIGIPSSKDADDGATDMNSFFFRKRPARNEKVPLFKFEYSLHGLRGR